MIHAEKLSDAVTLYEGECEDVLPILSSVDAVVTDPPYGILNLQVVGTTISVRKSPRQQGSGKLKNRLLNNSNVQWDIPPTAELLNDLREKSKWQVIWGGNYFPLPPTRGVLVWDKEQPWPNFSQAEIAWTNLERPAALFRCRSGDPDKVHPTQKPLALMRWSIGFLPPEARVILDPYAGSGTTGVAAVIEGRTAILIEKNPAYCEIIRRRIAEAEAVGPQSLFKDQKHADLFAQPGMEVA